MAYLTQRSHVHLRREREERQGREEEKRGGVTAFLLPLASCQHITLLVSLNESFEHKWISGIKEGERGFFIFSFSFMHIEAK